MNILRVFYAFVALLSALSLYNNVNDVLFLSVFVSVTGIVSAVLFFAKQYQFYYVVFFWIIIQIPNITLDTMNFDQSQFLSINLALTIGDLRIGLNSQILFLLIVNYILLSQYLGKKITVKPFTEKAKGILVEPFSLVVTGISESKKLVSTITVNVNKEDYQKIYLTPVKDARFKKAKVTLLQLPSRNEVSGMVTFEVE